MTSTVQQENTATVKRRDIQQQVTDTIIQQLEAGTVPWHKPWNGGSDRLMSIPQNQTTGKKYRGINILLLWTSAFTRQLTTDDWGSFKQWNEKKEAVRKGEKGSLVIYYDTLEKDVDGEIKKIPFLKTSVVFNRCQLASYDPKKEGLLNEVSLVEKIDRVDSFIANTSAEIENKDFRACYSPSEDKILMPHKEAFIHTEDCTATEGYYATLLHELTHWTGNEKRINRRFGKKFGDNAYAVEELTAELGAAFMAAEFGITVPSKANHAGYIAYWLDVLKNNKQCLFASASEASKAVDYLQGLQPA